jgi:hypothetical protein
MEIPFFLASLSIAEEELQVPAMESRFTKKRELI